MLGQRALALEARENPKRMNTLRHASRQRDIAFIQSQHLRALDQSGVARRTRSSDCIVRTDDARVQRDLAGRIVGDRARIVMMGPEGGVVVVTLQLKDLILRLNVAVLRDADVYPDP